MSTKGISWG